METMDIRKGKGNGCAAVMGRLRVMAEVPTPPAVMPPILRVRERVESALRADMALARECGGDCLSHTFSPQLSLLLSPRFQKAVKALPRQSEECLRALKRLLLTRDSVSRLAGMAEEAPREEDLQELFVRFRRVICQTQESTWFREATVCMAPILRAEQILHWQQNGALGAVSLQPLAEDSRAVTVANALHFPILHSLQPHPEGFGESPCVILNAKEGSLLLSPNSADIAEFAASLSEKNQAKKGRGAWGKERFIVCGAESPPSPSEEYDGILLPTLPAGEESELTERLFAIAERMEQKKILTVMTAEKCDIPHWRAVSLASVSGSFLCAVAAAEPEELVLCRKNCQSAWEELKKEGREFAQGVRIGAWIHTVQAALNAEMLATHADFIWIDGDSLLQALQYHRDAFMKLLCMTVAAACRHGKWTGLSGKQAIPWIHEPDQAPLPLQAIAIPT